MSTNSRRCGIAAAMPARSISITSSAAWRRPSAAGELSRRISARSAALGMHSLLEGLLQNWMLDPQAFDLVRVGTQVIDTYLAGLAIKKVAAGAEKVLA